MSIPFLNEMLLIMPMLLSPESLSETVRPTDNRLGGYVQKPLQ